MVAEQDPAPTWLARLAPCEAEARRDARDQFHDALRHGTMRLGLYAPSSRDGQEPHRQDELYVVARGSGWFVKSGERCAFTAGDAIFVEAGVTHYFDAFTDDFAAWVVFWGMSGGER